MRTRPGPRRCTTLCYRICWHRQKPSRARAATGSATSRGAARLKEVETTYPQTEDPVGLQLQRFDDESSLSSVGSVQRDNSEDSYAPPPSPSRFEEEPGIDQAAFATGMREAVFLDPGGLRWDLCGKSRTTQRRCVSAP